MPKTRVRFWRAKLEGNLARDTKIRAKLRRDKWDVLVIWECQTLGRHLGRLASRISRFLDVE
jgi:DNA mismatch endonuclease (patch repair protein)